MKKEIVENFGDMLRVRVCGILIKQNSVLMVKHQGLSKAGYLWAPPGGGMSFGQSAIECLKKEYLEETGLNISVSKFLFVHEFHSHPLHAMELFYQVEAISGQLQVGYDPELGPNQQIIQEVRYLNQNDIQSEKRAQLHSIFQNVSHPKELLNLKGYFQNWK